MAINHGVKTVTTAGTDVALATSVSATLPIHVMDSDTLFTPPEE